MNSHIKLPVSDGTFEQYRLSGTPVGPLRENITFNRIAFSAAHVVADPRGANELNESPCIDWERTIAYRRYLIGAGFGIAEAMDTAQRGMGLNWSTAKELIRRTISETRDLPGALIFSGCGTDQLAASDAASTADVIRAYEEQLSAIQALGGRVILMSSRALARVARTAEDYKTVYKAVLANADKPVILHWLGSMFDPELAGYWGSDTFEGALDTCLEIIRENAAKIDGIKISLLDKDKEIRMRRLLPPGVNMYTGDDFNYPGLIEGDEQGHSHALLGIFDAIAPVASHALQALGKGDNARYHALMDPTVPLSRLIFRAPTQYYKTGVVFLAYLNGHQDHFIMLGGHHAFRPLPYFVELFRLADRAGLLRDPERAAARMQGFLRQYGID